MWKRERSSVTILSDLLHFGQLFEACGNNYFAQIAHIVRHFLKWCPNLSFFWWNHIWATFIDIWQLFTGHTGCLLGTACRRHLPAVNVWASSWWELSKKAYRHVHDDDDDDDPISTGLVEASYLPTLSQSNINENRDGRLQIILSIVGGITVQLTSCLTGLHLSKQEKLLCLHNLSNYYCIIYG